MNWIAKLFGRFGTRRKPRRIKATCLCGKVITMRRDGQFYKHHCIAPLENLEQPNAIQIDETVEELLGGPHGASSL